MGKQGAPARNLGWADRGRRALFPPHSPPYPASRLGLARVSVKAGSRRPACPLAFATPRTARFSVLPDFWGRSGRGNSARSNSPFLKTVPVAPGDTGNWTPGGRPRETARNGASPALHVAGTVPGPQGPEQQRPAGAAATLPPCGPFAPDPCGGLGRPHEQTVWRPQAHRGSGSNEKSENVGLGVGLEAGKPGNRPGAAPGPSRT